MVLGGKYATEWATAAIEPNDSGWAPAETATEVEAGAEVLTPAAPVTPG